MSKTLLAGLLLLLSARASFAQDFGIAYTSTNIDWDEQTNRIEASCTMFLDYVAEVYYESAINCYIYHDSNVPAHIVANNWGYGTNYVDVDLEYNYPTPDTTYSTQGTYFVSLPYYYYDSGDYFYYDPYDYDFYLYAGIYQPFWYDFYGYDAPGWRVNYETLFLGYLYDSTQTPPSCGDERTNIIQEYVNGGVDWTPSCGDFTQSVPTLSQYSFAQWNSGDYSWAVLRESVVGNLYCVVNNYGSTPGFNSGYRNPVHNVNVGGATNSRHVYGDAADLDTPSAPDNDADTELRRLAKDGSCGNACVEPRNISPSHFHVDYRGSCPADW